MCVLCQVEHLFSEEFVQVELKSEPHSASLAGAILRTYFSEILNKKTDLLMQIEVLESDSHIGRLLIEYCRFQLPSVVLSAYFTSVQDTLTFESTSIL